MQDVASAINVAKSSYSLWEEGIERIPLNRLIDICDYFNVSVDYLLDLTNQKNYSNNHKSYIKNVLAKNLKSIRKEQKITQEKLAKRLSLTRTTIINYEKGITTPLLDYILYFCRTYNISADYLLGRIDKKPF